MGEKIVVGPITHGLQTNVTAFNVDNDAFPTLINAYQWRGRVKRKRGTSQLGRLQRYFDSTNTSYNSGSTTITLNGSGAGNLITGFSLETNAALIPTTIEITGVLDTYEDTDGDGILYDSGASAAGSISYATGAFTIAAEAGNAISAVFRYYPVIPVMGLEDYFDDNSSYQKTLGFDQTYAYNITTTSPAAIYDISFYKNPPTGTYSGYTEKTNITPVRWNGGDYQQFFSSNYQGAFWVTNGVDVPFTGTNLGLPLKSIDDISVTSATTADIGITAHGLVVGDFIFINEVTTTTGISLQTGYVTTVIGPNDVTVTFPSASIATNSSGEGICMYLTNVPDNTKDCMRWYDGDPTDGSDTSPVLDGHKGWVNFCPPLSQSSYSINDLPQDQYYLVTSKMVVPFKDRLIFVGPVVQTKNGDPIYLEDTVLWSNNGTAFYTASFTGTDPVVPTTSLSILVPDDQTGYPVAYWSDVTGLGGWKATGLTVPINSVGFDGDAIILGLPRTQLRMVYTQNDLDPFNYYIINSELGTDSTFSAIDMDNGVISRGNRGFIITSQTASQRIDTIIPDLVFQLKLTNQGAFRVTAARDFINEWIYFSFPSNRYSLKFPTRTLQLNYRDGTWGIFDETFTTYGQYRPTTGYTWANIGTKFPTWSVWNEPWNAGASTLLQPKIIAGNAQGFVMVREEGTSEQPSLEIQSFSSSTITSPNHGLNSGDFIIISNCVGTISEEVNGKIFQIDNAMTDTFDINPPLSGSLAYQGNGVITRLYRPYIQTRQFPVSWGLSRKTRLGPQQYLLTTTDMGQISLLIFLSQNDDNAYNTGPIVPSVNPENNALIYSTVLYTSPESTNLGLTSANINLNMPTASQQQQIWHRMNTSLLGDTVQVGFTMSDQQMFTYSEVDDAVDLTGATQANPCVLSCTGQYSAGQMIKISGIATGMTELNYTDTNYNVYQVLSSTPTTVTIDVNSSGFNAYTTGGVVQPVAPVFQTEEIEIHSFILDVQPSSLLA